MQLDTSDTGSLLAIAGILSSLLIIFYIYTTKKFCFQSVSKCWCCKKANLPTKCRASKELVNAFSYDDELDSSSDCDEDVMHNLQQRLNNNYDANMGNYGHEDNGNQKYKQYNKLVDHAKTDTFSNSVDIPRERIRHIQRQHSLYTDNDETLDHFKHRPKNILKQQAIYASLALKNNTKTFESILANSKDSKPKANDLISLAEKGRIGKQNSTEGSASSEAGSAEDSIIVEKKNILRRLKTASSETESKETADGHKYQILNSYLDNYESDTQSSNLPDFSPNTTLSEPIMVNSIKCGRLEVSFAYDAPSKRLCITVIQGNEIPYKEQRTGVNQIYVQIILLPHKKQKYKTKSKPIFCPIFNESFTFNRINPEDILNLGLRFRVYSIGFARKTHLIGESQLLFVYMKPQQQETKLWFTLEPRKRNSQSDLRSEASSLARTDSTSSQSLHNTLPELLLGLSYNGTTGRLSVTIIKGSQFRSVTTRAPDTYVKLTLISSSGQEIARSKTSVCRGQPNPHFKETFIFQVALFQLPDVTLMIAAYNKRSIKRKELVGWISLGYNSSGEEELSHWNDMRDSKGEQVSRWHVLLQS